MLIQKIFTVCLLSLLLVSKTSMSTSAGAATISASNAAHLQSEYQSDMNRILVVRNADSLSDMKTLADSLQSKWSKIGGDYYYFIMDGICKGFSTLNLHTNDQYVLAEKFAWMALENPDACPVDPVVTLSLNLRQVNSEKLQSPLATKQWLLLRQSTAKHWLYALYRLKKEIDPDFNPSDLPAISISPPSGTTLSSGADPKDIKDEIIRAAYEAAIEKNEQKRVMYNKQYQLRTISKTYSTLIERDIITAYSTAPYNSAELQHLLDTYLSDNATKQRILDQVTKNMAAGQS